MLRACLRVRIIDLSLTTATRVPVSLNTLGFRVCSTHAHTTTTRNNTQNNSKSNLKIKMGKNNKKKAAPPPESLFHIVHPASSSSSRAIVDTHTHLASTFEAYRHKYPSGQYETVYDFVKGLYAPAGVEAMVDVWCEAPVRPIWKEFADAAVVDEERAERWGGVEYWFVMGVHPHEARLYDDAVEADILEAMTHPRCVGWGEIGLDYHYDNSPRPVQQAVFARQLRHAVRLGKPLTIHTREADEDTERILKEEVPREHRIHIHCFTDSPAFAQRLLDWFPNLYIGITGASLLQSQAFLPSLPFDDLLRAFPRLPARHAAPPGAVSVEIAVGRGVWRALGLAHDNLRWAPGAAPPALILALPMHTASGRRGAWSFPSCVRFSPFFSPFPRPVSLRSPARTSARSSRRRCVDTRTRSFSMRAHHSTIANGAWRVITYTSNTDTSTAVRNMFASAPSSTPSSTSASTLNANETIEADEDKKLRILLETDAPYMVPAPIYTSAPFVEGEGKGKKLPLCHSGMVPWTAEFVAGLLAPTKEGQENEKKEGGGDEVKERGGWDASRVMRVARANARVVYGV
ncbi:hypothetical protein MSAN_02455000 [Mycena sanguinolenta]|uniref:Metallo-dependent hydrolase n=1 Tax=Mycena sanguinolenta TaxID=230812 RepID=A0A8H7CBZ8_9AGAR|nr:hypothetical protein MSAN_02455000 [Mycena sanguinolenta]